MCPLLSAGFVVVVVDSGYGGLYALAVVLNGDLCVLAQSVVVPFVSVTCMWVNKSVSYLLI